MKTLLCIGGPIDGEVRVIDDCMRTLMVVTALPFDLPVRRATALPAVAERHYTEHRYESLRLGDGVEFLYYEPNGPAQALCKLLACYTPRLAKLAEDEQRRVDRQVPPGDLQAKR